MTKTIEEAADRVYFAHMEATKSIPLYGIGKASRFHFHNGFEYGINYIKSLPLASRLTEAEK